jgi:hypothetical protein
MGFRGKHFACGQCKDSVSDLNLLCFIYDWKCNIKKNPPLPSSDINRNEEKFSNQFFHLVQAWSS